MLAGSFSSDPRLPERPLPDGVYQPRPRRVLPPDARLAMIVIAAVIVAAAFAFAKPNQVILSAGLFTEERAPILLFREDVTATVTLRKLGPDYLSLELNGVNVAGTSGRAVGTRSCRGTSPCCSHPTRSASCTSASAAAARRGRCRGTRSRHHHRRDLARGAAKSPAHASRPSITACCTIRAYTSRSTTAATSSSPRATNSTSCSPTPSTRGTRATGRSTRATTSRSAAAT